MHVRYTCTYSVCTYCVVSTYVNTCSIVQELEASLISTKEQAQQEQFAKRDLEGEVRSHLAASTMLKKELDAVCVLHTHTYVHVHTHVCRHVMRNVHICRCYVLLCTYLCCL